MDIPTLRIGHGLDAHRLEAGRELWLGCCLLKYDRGLAGHSDGDCSAHALADAVLGGAGLGGLGDHFPSHDPRWANISGHDLLQRCAALLTDSGWTVTSAQVVVVAEAPRLAAYLRSMSSAMSGALGMADGAVRVGATSTDGLGMLGRGEGIAASAVALLVQR